VKHTDEKGKVMLCGK